MTKAEPVLLIGEAGTGNSIWRPGYAQRRVRFTTAFGLINELAKTAMSATRRRASGSGLAMVAGDEASWADAGAAGSVLGDKRLCSRLRQLERVTGALLPLARQEWGSAKAA